MGGRGSSSGLIAPVRRVAPTQQQTQQIPQPQPQPQPQQQPKPIVPPAPPPPVLTPDVIADLTTWTDDELAQAVIDSKTVQMPNMLSDVDDVTQRFIYQIGANDKPIVLDDQQFDQFMQDNNISYSAILARQVSGATYRNKDGTLVKLTGDQISRMLKSSRYNYIGGKVGGQAYGAGTYFDMNGGQSTGYGSSGGKVTAAVLNPATARVIDDRTLQQKAAAFAKAHPKFAKAVGPYNNNFSGGKNNMGIYAMAMGYNVIKDYGGSYHNVIDRRAIVVRKDDR